MIKAFRRTLALLLSIAVLCGSAAFCLAEEEEADATTDPVQTVNKIPVQGRRATRFPCTVMKGND